MKIGRHQHPAHGKSASRGSVLVIVLWVSLGLISITLYFAHSMTLALRATDNRVAGLVAEQAVESGYRYACVVLSNSFVTTEPGLAPDVTAYKCAAVPLGDSQFWFIGRSGLQQVSTAVANDAPYFGLVDECSKINLNLADTNLLEMLQYLPHMTPELAAAIMDWRDEDLDVTPGGAESEIYTRMRPPYSCSNLPFKTVDELRMVYNCNTELLFGEDANLNGVLDQNENDGTISLPYDNKDGRFDPGLFEYVTVYSHEPNVRADGTSRVNVNETPALQTYLQEKFSEQRATEIIANAANPAQKTSLLQFYILSKMTPEEMAQIEGEITVFSNTVASITGLVNVATAPLEVLSCIRGIGPDLAPNLVSFRSSNPTRMTSIAWVSEVLEQTNAVMAGPYLTSRSFQYTADVAAIGQFGRGYRRTRFLIDMEPTGVAKMAHRQDLTHLGWALGVATRRTLLTQNIR